MSEWIVRRTPHLIAILTLATFIGAGVTLWLVFKATQTDSRVTVVERSQDPCAAKGIHSSACQTNTCIRRADVGAPLTSECKSRLANLNDEEVVGNGGNNNPSNRPGGRQPAPTPEPTPVVPEPPPSQPSPAQPNCVVDAAGLCVQLPQLPL